MARRSSKIKTQEGDAVEFIQQVNSILESMVDDLDIGEVVFVKIRNWFDQKWLNYSGKTIVHFPMRGLLDSGPEEALDCIWMKEITIPPFNPKRVLSSRFVRVKDTGNKRIEKSRSRLQAKYRNRAPSGQGLHKGRSLVMVFVQHDTQSKRLLNGVYLAKRKGRHLVRAV